MRYAQINSKYVCGIDIHARNMYACVMDEKGEILFHRNMRTDFPGCALNVTAISNHCFINRVYLLIQKMLRMQNHAGILFYLI